MGLAVGGERELQRFLGAGLADRAGDGDHLGVRARARGAGKIAQSLEHIVDGEQRRIGGKAPALRPRDHRETGAGFERALDKFMAVTVLALDGEEGIAFAERAAVDGDARHLRRQRA